MQSVRKILLYLVLFFLSCKKDYVKLDYPSTYHKSKKETSPVRVFTHNGEIKQSAVVNRYATVDSTWFIYYRDALDSIKLIDEQNALMVEGYSSLKFNLAISGNDIRFSSKDTFAFYSAGDIFTRSINYQVGQFKPPVYSEYILSSASGNYLFAYSGRKEYYLTRENDGLKAPWIALVVHSKGVYQQFAVQNKLDNNFYKFIAATDTVVIQQFVTWYEK